MSFRFVKEIQLPGNGIFLSALPDGRAYHRKDHISIAIRRGRLTEDWEFIPDEDWERPGWEDPRVFVSGGHRYCANNLLNGCGIRNLDTGEEISLNLPGKNFTYLPGEPLSFISWFNPLEIHTLDSGRPRKSVSRRLKTPRMPLADSWRGGTPGVLLEPGVYAGFGHRTTTDSGVLTHHPFVWRLLTNRWRYKLESGLVELPDRWRICDPTCILERGGKWFLITAQSPLAWLVEQPLRTVVYEFDWQGVLAQCP